MFDFGNANAEQRKAIAAADGPVLITAGPGTGKTYTLVQRAIYLIEEHYPQLKGKSKKHKKEIKSRTKYHLTK